uniref:Protein kinase domain-containing protein n=1 Tax=Chromera velia CCMP2878 TaxID=1169474 RepID=A0A0G4F7V4_9ALVE|eukprot:Cvel_2946.t1-p1 / transcript=Cvel_2946.t1 / gene=Cvel_2946 / organism=Chromera_velia_CCMP2878 / gene_product=Serine/threonine-protein kinase PKH3, putative / transcript_product=Serine/threonine-protein kinase PKH3, putative / location=Cvel_scaffold116:90663-96199(-) / protein_length=495 / sequence_SO=supercontig / SO=protein_coding / is_pseudo=false
MSSPCEEPPEGSILREMCRGDVWFKFPLARGGHLAAVIRRKNFRTCEGHLRWVRHTMRLLLEAFDKLHDLSVIHYDTKPPNFLLTGEDKGLVRRIWLCDLEFAQLFSEGPPGVHDEVRGTVFYRAPEVLSCSKVDFHTVDEWGAGCTLYEMILVDFEGPMDRKPLFEFTTEGKTTTECILTESLLQRRLSILVGSAGSGPGAGEGEGEGDGKRGQKRQRESEGEEDSVNEDQEEGENEQEEDSVNKDQEEGENEQEEDSVNEDQEEGENEEEEDSVNEDQEEGENEQEEDSMNEDQEEGENEQEEDSVNEDQEEGENEQEEDSVNEDQEEGENEQEENSVDDKITSQQHPPEDPETVRRRLLENLKTDHFPDFDGDALDLLSRLLHPTASARISAKSALQHPFFSQTKVSPGTPSQPAPSQPAPSHSEPSQPAPFQPAPSHSAPSQSAPSQPAPSHSAPSQPAPPRVELSLPYSLRDRLSHQQIREGFGRLRDQI